MPAGSFSGAVRAFLVPALGIRGIAGYSAVAVGPGTAGGDAVVAVSVFIVAAILMVVRTAARSRRPAPYSSAGSGPIPVGPRRIGVVRLRRAARRADPGTHLCLNLVTIRTGSGRSPCARGGAAVPCPGPARTTAAVPRRVGEPLRIRARPRPPTRLPAVPEIAALTVSLLVKYLVRLAADASVAARATRAAPAGLARILLSRRSWTLLRTQLERIEHDPV